MKHFLTLHSYAARRALIALWHKPVVALLNLIMLGLAISLPLVMYLAVSSLAEWTGRLTSQPQLTLFMANQATRADLNVVAHSLKQNPRIAHASFMPKDTALQQLIIRNNLTNLSGGLQDNPLPDAFIVTPSEQSPKQLEQLQTTLAGLPLVESVQFDAAWAKRLYSLIELGHQLTWVLACALILALVLTTHNTIRLQVLARHDEIEVAKLMGATNGFIRRPFIYFALWQGLFAVVAGLLLASWFISAANPSIRQLAQLYNEYAALQFPNALEVLALFVIVLLFSIVGARLATRAHLRLHDPR